MTGVKNNTRKARRVGHPSYWKKTNVTAEYKMFRSRMDFVYKLCNAGGVRVYCDNIEITQHNCVALLQETHNALDSSLKKMDNLT